MSLAPETVLEATTPDARALLRRINLRIVAVRRAIRHDHRDEPFWAAFGMTAPQAQAERLRLRAVADEHHVERATARGRLHGTRFKSLEEQRASLPDDLAENRRHTSRFLDGLRPIRAT
jgi:hypothetical protein